MMCHLVEQLRIIWKKKTHNFQRNTSIIETQPTIAVDSSDNFMKNLHTRDEIVHLVCGVMWGDVRQTTIVVDVADWNSKFDVIELKHVSKWIEIELFVPCDGGNVIDEISRNRK